MTFQIASLTFFPESKKSSHTKSQLRNLRSEFNFINMTSSTCKDWTRYSSSINKKESQLRVSCISLHSRPLDNLSRNPSTTSRITSSGRWTCSRWWRSMIARILSSHPLQVSMGIRTIVWKVISRTPQVHMVSQRLQWRCCLDHSPSCTRIGELSLWDISTLAVAINPDWSATNHMCILTTCSHSFNKSLWERDRDWIFSVMTIQLLMELVWETTFILQIWLMDMFWLYKNWQRWKLIMMFSIWEVERDTVSLKL